MVDTFNFSINGEKRKKGKDIMPKPELKIELKGVDRFIKAVEEFKITTDRFIETLNKNKPFLRRTAEAMRISMLANCYRVPNLNGLLNQMAEDEEEEVKKKIKNYNPLEVPDTCCDSPELDMEVWSGLCKNCGNVCMGEEDSK